MLIGQSSDVATWDFREKRSEKKKWTRATKNGDAKDGKMTRKESQMTVEPRNMPPKHQTLSHRKSAKPDVRSRRSVACEAADTQQRGQKRNMPHEQKRGGGSHTQGLFFLLNLAG